MQQSLIEKTCFGTIRYAGPGRTRGEVDDVQATANGKVWTESRTSQEIDDKSVIEAAVKDTAKAGGISGGTALFGRKRSRTVPQDIIAGRVQKYLPDREKCEQAGRFLVLVE